MVLILTSTVTNRLRYISRLMLQQLFGLEVDYTVNPEEFTRFEGPKINYSRERVEGGLWIYPQKLLFETNIAETPVEADTVMQMPVIFRDTSGSGGFPFDPFAAGFYMVTRYEEYLGKNKDRHGRFSPKGSIAFTGNFLDKPVVNIWAASLVSELKKSHPGLPVVQPSFRFVSTIDIDHAYAYRYRGLTRTLGGTLRSVTRGRFGDIFERYAVLLGMKKDPYDTYGFIRKVHEKYHLRPIFFILFADYGKNDNNVDVTARGFARLIRSLQKWARVGVHPSLRSHREPMKLEKEIAGLSAVTGRPVTRSRQHFLKFSLPRTFRQLISLGITEEYSMGYAALPGFRAGIANPYCFFDLFKNEASILRIHPVALMDVSLKDYMHLDRKQSLALIKQMIDAVRSVNGEFINLWHNESLSGKGDWRGWQDLFEETLAYATENSK
jgi:hypothetical protein